MAAPEEHADGSLVAAGAALSACYPWFKFYPANWQGDAQLGLCSPGARGLLMELLCIMHRATPRGCLLVNGKQPADPVLARLVRMSPKDVRRFRDELLDQGVLSMQDNGTIFSRRMVRDAQQSAIGRENGKLGGNPALKRLTPSLTQGDNTQMPDTRSQMPEERGERTGASRARVPSRADSVHERATKKSARRSPANEQIADMWVYVGNCVRIWRDLHDEFSRLAGSAMTPNDLLEWYSRLDAEAVKQGLGAPDTSCIRQRLFEAVLAEKVDR